MGCSKPSFPLDSFPGSSRTGVAPATLKPVPDALWERRKKNPRSSPQADYVFFFALIHLGALVALFSGPAAEKIIIFTASFAVQGLGITTGYHRYFSHRSFKTSRTFQFFLALAGTLAVQKGVLWWVAHHRHHHRFSDTAGDPHSPRDGALWSHMGWFLSSATAPVDREAIRDLARFPELVWLDRWFMVPPALGALCLTLAFGWSGLLWGFCLSTTAAWHLTYAVNSLAHRIGSRRFETGDDSRNLLPLALLTFGEGWHNNHHRFPSAARQGLRWWEIDPTYYLLRMLSTVGIVWDLIEPRSVPSEESV